MGVPLVRRGGWAQIVHLVTTTAFFSFKALCYKNTNPKLKIQYHIFFFTLNILVKSDCHFLKACLNSYGENCRYLCGLHCTNQTCDRFNGSCLIGCADGFYGKACDKGNVG